MFLGGSETSSHTLSFSVYFMVLNQHVQKKVQAEIDEIVPNGMPPSLNDLPRLKQVLNVNVCLNVSIP